MKHDRSALARSALRRLIAEDKERAEKAPVTVQPLARSARLDLSIPQQERHALTLTPRPQDHEAHRAIDAPASRILMLNQSARISEQAAPENAFEDMQKPAVANSSAEPRLSKERVNQFVKEAVQKHMATHVPAIVEDQVEAIAPQKIANIFTELGTAHAELTIERIAPDRIKEVAERVLPEMVDASIKEHVSNFMANNMGPALQNQISNSIRKELSGAMGQRVTEKIRMLINAEIVKLRAANRF